MRKNRSLYPFTRLTNAFFRALPIVALMLAASQMAFGIRLALAAANLTATKTVALAVDVNNNGQPDPGDTLGYTVTVNNTGADPALNSAFSDTIDANTTLVAGSVKTTPLARNDSGFSTVGNVLLTVSVAQSVLNNDNDPDGSGALTITTPTVASTHGGSAVLAADGSFTYNPPVGYAGPDTFTYTVKDVDNNTDSATVSITVGPQVVWFIDNAAATNGDGRSASPFNSITGFNAATTQAGQIVYVAQGSGAYSGTITLLNNQQLLGSGTALTVAPNLNLAAGTRPTIANVALASGNTVRGLNLAASSGTALSGGSVGALTVDTASVSNTSGVGVSLGSGALTVTLDSVSASGGANGIVLNNTTGSFAVNGGTIQNNTGAGVLLTSAQNIALTNLTLQNIAGNGVDGSGVVNFSFVNGAINNVGTGLAGQYDESAIAFEDKAAPFTDNTVSGTVTITGSTLSNAARHGVAIETWNGTISALTLSGNTFTSSTSAASSLGDAIHVFAQGSDTTTANLTTAAITNNAITNFPNGHGIVVAGGSGSATNNTSATLGASTASPITITGNTVTGNAGKTFGNAIMVTFNGNNGVSHFNISNNGTVANPLTNFGGLGISAFFGGSVTGTAKIDNNVIVAHNTAGSAGIAVQVDDGPRQLGTDTASIAAEVIGNNISANSGNDIRGIARASAGSLNLTVQNNTVTAPITANREGIRVDSGSAVGNTNVCLKITGNTSAGSGVNGIGLRKQGTTANINTFGVDGLSPSPATAAQTQGYVAGQNPAGNNVDIISGDNFVACTVAPIVSVSGPAMAQQAPTQRLTLAWPDFTALRASAASALANLASRLTEQAGRFVRAFTVQPVQASGETVSLALGTLDPGQQVVITFQAALNNSIPDSVAQICNQGTVTADGGISVQTDNPAVGGATDPTCIARPDTVPPDTTINTQPANPSNVSAPVFTFSGTDNVTPAASLTFECALDGGAFTACTSPFTAPTLADGSHTFAVRAKDQAGNLDASPASYTWVIDTTPPDTTLGSTPTSPTNTTTVFTFSGSDNLTPAPSLTFECQMDAGAWLACTSPFTPAGQTDGSHTFNVRAKDQAGNVDPTPATFTWVVDTTPPDTSITANPPSLTNSTTASFSFTGSDAGTGVASFECALDGGSFSACTSPQTYTGLADGSHTFQVRAKDGAGNVDPTPASYTWVVDTAAPDTSITANPPSLTNSTSASFSFTGNDSGSGVASFECALDGGGFSACTSPQTYTGLANGPHTFQVRAVDGIGNVDPSPASYTWTVDTVAPTVTINQAAGQADPTTASPIHFTAVFSEAVTGFTGADVTLTGGTTAVVTEIAPNNGTTYDVAVSGMPTNANSNVTATIPANAATDLAGNASQASTSTDNTVTYQVLPDLTLTKSHSGSFNQLSTGTYTLTVNNIGGSATSGTVTVVDTLPSGLTASALSGVGWSCTLATLTCTRADALAAGSSYPAITLTVQVGLNAPASVTNNATVSGGGEQNTANDSASDPTTVNPANTYAQITPNNATCTQFAAHSAADLSQVTYGVVSNRVRTVSPSSFLYFTKVFAPTSTFTIKVSQANDKGWPSLGNAFSLANPQINVYNANCQVINATGQFTNTSITFTVKNATFGAAYYVSIRYQADSVLNKLVSAPYPQVTYTINTAVNNVTLNSNQDTVLFKPQ